MARMSLPGLVLPGLTRETPGRSRLATAGPILANVALVALAAWIVTRWAWHFYPGGQTAAPPPVQRERQVPIAAVAEQVAAAQLFGAAAQVAPAPVAISTLNVKLKGVFAGRPNQPAVAIVNTGQQDEFVRTGNEIAPGVVLDSVHPTHVVVNRSGRLERVELEDRATGGTPPLRVGVPQRPGPQSRASRPPPVPGPQAGPLTPPVPGAPSIPPPPPQNIPGVPENIQGMSTQPAGVGRVALAGGGLTVQEAPPGSMLDRFGLQPGDVIKSVNGAPVAGQADIARLYAQASAGRALQGEIVRAGKTLPITIAIKN